MISGERRMNQMVKKPMLSEILARKRRWNTILRRVVMALPLGGVVAASFLSLKPWMQQSLVLITILWFQAFFLQDYFFTGK